jgi:hypothetical protein
VTTTGSVCNEPGAAGDAVAAADAGAATNFLASNNPNEPRAEEYRNFLRVDIIYKKFWLTLVFIKTKING